MSNVKYEAIVQSGIEIVNRIEIPEELIPPDAQVHIVWLDGFAINGHNDFIIAGELVTPTKYFMMIRVPCPPKVELSAKVLSGYHTQRSSSFDVSVNTRSLSFSLSLYIYHAL